jgi:hypothetical protein
LWGLLKEKVYMNNPHPFEERKENIGHEIYTILVQQLCHVFRNTLSQYEACLEAEGHHFKTILYTVN